MANYPTTNIDTISSSQAAKEVTANAFFDAASTATYFGRRAAGSSALTWAYYGAVLMISGVPTRFANGSLSLPASSTCYIEATAAGAVSYNTTGWTSGRMPLYKVVTGASTVTSYEDFRCLSFTAVP